MNFVINNEEKDTRFLELEGDSGQVILRVNQKLVAIFRMNGDFDVYEKELEELGITLKRN